MTDLYNKKVTIYNDIPASDEAPRTFGRFVIELCNIQGGFVDKANGTVRNVVNAKTVITKDVAHYKSPLDYCKLSAEQRKDLFTAQIGDFVVLGEVDDVVENAQQFIELQKKYQNNGLKITSVSPNIHGMSVDNISMTNA